MCGHMTASKPLGREGGWRVKMLVQADLNGPVIDTYVNIHIYIYFLNGLVIDTYVAS